MEYGGQGLSDEHQRPGTRRRPATRCPMPGGIAGGVDARDRAARRCSRHASEEQKRGLDPEDPERRRDLGAAPLRARRRLRPRRHAHPGHPRRRRWVLNGTKIWSSRRDERRLRHLPGPDGLGRPQAPGPDLVQGADCTRPGVTVDRCGRSTAAREFCEEFLDDVEPSATTWSSARSNGGWPIANSCSLSSGAAAAAARPRRRRPVGRRRLAPDLVELATARGARRRPGRAPAHRQGPHQRLRAARARQAGGRVDDDGARPTPSVASLIKLGIGHPPARCGRLRRWRSAGRAGIAWEPTAAPGHAAAVELPQRPDHVDRRGQQPDPAEHHRRAAPRAAREPSVDADKPFRDVLRDAKTWGTKG